MAGFGGTCKWCGAVLYSIWTMESGSGGCGEEDGSVSSSSPDFYIKCRNIFKNNPDNVLITYLSVREAAIPWQQLTSAKYRYC